MKSRIPAIVLTLAFVTAAVAAVNFYVARNTERARRLVVETENKAVVRAKQRVEEERDELAKAKGALEEQMSDLGKQAKDLAEKLAQEKRARDAVTTELAQVRREVSDLRGKLQAADGEKQTLTQDLAKSKQSYQALSNELTTLRQAKEALEKRVKEMLAARAKEAEQIVVTGQPGSASGGDSATTAVKPVGTAAALKVPPAGKGPEGKVLVVNREFSFVVVNLGSKDGVRKGTRMIVLRGEKPVVGVEVEKVYDNMSAANLLAEEKKGEVQEGNVVRIIS